MPKFVRKHLTVDAEQYFDCRKEPDGVCFCHHQQHRMAHIHTPEGLLLVKDKDWIVTGPEVQKSVLNPEVFKHLYEPAE